MADNGLIGTEERKEKIRELTENLDDRFRELLWNYPARISKLQSYKPTVLPEFWNRHTELEARLSEYLDGKIEWNGEQQQMTFTEILKMPVAEIVIDRDVENYARDLFCWVVEQVRGL